MHYRVACARFGDDGAMYHPRWTGTRWRWYTHTDFATEVPESDVEDLAMVRVQTDGYWAQAYWYEEDGSSPDKRSGKLFVTRRFRGPRHNHVGRELTAEEVLADLEHWINLQHAHIVACCAEVLKQPRHFGRHEDFKAKVRAPQDRTKVELT